MKLKIKEDKIIMNLIPENRLKKLLTDEFKGKPRIEQIDAFLKSLFDAGHLEVSPRDISQIFKDADMRSPINQKKIRCGAFKVKEFFKSIITKEDSSEILTTNLKETSDNKYEISLKS